MRFGIILSDVPSSVPGRQQIRDLFRIVEAAQENGMRTIVVGQHFLYGDLRWLQPVPLLARLAAEVDPDVRLVTQVLIAPLYHPVMLAEELATLDIVTEGRLEVGLGLGYRADEFDYFEIPYKERAPRLDETLSLLPRLWTERSVTHRGRFFHLDAVEPHIRPVQEPYPPIWIGAHSDKGAERAGRYGDYFVVPPETPVDVIRQRFALVKSGLAARGMPFGPQPTRRNVLVGPSRQEALEEFARIAKGRYVTYAQRGLDVYSEDELQRDFIEATANHAFVGTVDEVVEGLASLVDQVPLDPIIMKPQWPSMSGDETVKVIETLGSTVVAALRDHQGVQDLVGG